MKTKGSVPKRYRQNRTIKAGHSRMFDSQFCSLITVTFLVQLLGLFTVISYRLRSNRPFQQLGMVAGLLLMGVATLICLPLDAFAGMTQGVSLVIVATLSTFGREEASF